MKTGLDSFVLNTEKESIASQGKHTFKIHHHVNKVVGKQNSYNFSFNSATSEGAGRGSGDQSVRVQETWKHQGTKT